MSTITLTPKAAEELEKLKIGLGMATDREHLLALKLGMAVAFSIHAPIWLEQYKQLIQLADGTQMSTEGSLPMAQIDPDDNYTFYKMMSMEPASAQKSEEKPEPTTKSEPRDIISFTEYKQKKEQQKGSTLQTDDTFMLQAQEIFSIVLESSPAYVVEQMLIAANQVVEITQQYGTTWELVYYTTNSEGGANVIQMAPNLMPYPGLLENFKNAVNKVQLRDKH